MFDFYSTAIFDNDYEGEISKAFSFVSYWTGTVKENNNRRLVCDLMFSNNTKLSLISEMEIDEDEI